MRLQDYLEAIDGSEVSSLRYEGVVGIDGDRVIRCGEVIDRLTTKDKAKALFDEFFSQEFGTDGEVAAMLREEFGG